MLQVQLEGNEAEVRQQKEQLERLDQQIQGLQLKRQDVKDRTARAQANLAEETAKAARLQVCPLTFLFLSNQITYHLFLPPIGGSQQVRKRVGPTGV